MVRALSAKEYRAALERLGLSQVGAARLLGVNDVTSRRWIASGVNSSTAAIVLRLLIAGKIKIRDLESLPHD